VTRLAIIDDAMTMISVGANWEVLLTELYRKTLNRNFTRWDRTDVPSQATLIRWILKEYKAADMSEIRAKSVHALKTKLQRTAVQLALSGKSVPMLIFLLKNHCGYSDRPEGEAPIDVNLNVKNASELTDEELDSELRGVLRAIGDGKGQTKGIDSGKVAKKQAKGKH